MHPMYRQPKLKAHPAKPSPKRTRLKVDFVGFRQHEVVNMRVSNGDMVDETYPLLEFENKDLISHLSTTRIIA